MMSSVRPPGLRPDSTRTSARSPSVPTRPDPTRSSWCEFEEDVDVELAHAATA